MTAILPQLPIDHNPTLAKLFAPYQVHWIQAEDLIRAQGKQTFALAEKSVRIGWTFADAFKNVRKRLNFKNRDYLFATKDYPSALEYMRVCKQMVELFNLTRSILSHGEEFHKVPRLDDSGRPTGFTDELKMGVIKFDNGSRILAFSSHPQAMAVYAGDVGLDEFAKHPNARLLWETAQGRVTWGYDMAVWSSHDGEDTLFNEFVYEARQSLSGSFSSSSSASASLASPALRSASDEGGSSSSPARRSLGEGGFSSSKASAGLTNPCSPSGAAITPASSESPPDQDHPSQNTQHATRNTEVAPPTSLNHQPSTITPPWNLYYRVTLPDAIELGLLDVINRVQKTTFSPAQFIADCRSRARQEEIFQQAYMCNPMGAATNHIVEWSAIERCRYEYDMLRVHLEHAQIIQQFGEFSPQREADREYEIEDFINKKLLRLFQGDSCVYPGSSRGPARFRAGFDVAASGQGDLAAIYIDEVRADDLWLSGLFTCRTDDWHFIKAVLFKFLRHLRNTQMFGDASGLGRQICWDAANRFGGKFTAVNFGSKKHDIGFALMNQLATAQKRFPKSEQDVAADYFALRKSFSSNRWAFSESQNKLNPASHCDIAWAGGLATMAHNEYNFTARAVVG